MNLHHLLYHHCDDRIISLRVYELHVYIPVNYSAQQRPNRMNVPDNMKTLSK